MLGWGPGPSLLSEPLQSSLGPGLDNVGAEQGPEGPKFCPIGILIVRRWAQLCQNRGTVFLQREEQPGRRRAMTLRIVTGEGVRKVTHYFSVFLLEARLCWVISV